MSAAHHITLSLGDFGQWLRKLGPKYTRAAVAGLQDGADKLITNIQEQIDQAEPHKPVDTAQYRSAWRKTKLRDGARVSNDTVQASLVEFGRRPGPVSAEGYAHLREWIRRKKLYLDDFHAIRASRRADQARRIAGALYNANGTRRRGGEVDARRMRQAIRRQDIEDAIDRVAWPIKEKIRKEGFAPRHILARALLASRDDIWECVRAQVAKVGAK